MGNIGEGGDAEDRDLQRAMALSLREQQVNPSPNPVGRGGSAGSGGSSGSSSSSSISRPKGMSLGKKGPSLSIKSASSAGSLKALRRAPASGSPPPAAAAASSSKPKPLPPPPPPPVDDIFSQFGMNAEPTFGSGSARLAGLADGG
eukprot:CAMPEP_0182457398 /NCGR_PEP_ID=MMETSP1319-20130603/2976_1 /TAXON_ID=172717 /ORGANISM="Bolidomonas pacifica, Strain RCC208" /LENGTH=145 /DNA_ID=CAMNT_0024655855 /DNA_START=12 /DNA_END=445 /DNA_ORIENTATION=+